MSGVCKRQVILLLLGGGTLTRTDNADSRSALIMLLSAGTAGGKPVCDVSLAPVLDPARSLNICSFLLDASPAQTSRSGIINHANRMIDGNLDALVDAAIDIYNREGEPTNHGWTPRGVTGITINYASS